MDRDTDAGIGQTENTMSESCKHHCYHSVGWAKTSDHGSFAPQATSQAFRCCFYGGYESMKGRVLTPEEINFVREGDATADRTHV